MGTNLARDRAESLLAELLDTSRAVQIHNIVKTHPLMQCDTSLERAIESTRRMISSLNRALEQAELDLRDDHLDLLDELIDDDDDPVADREVCLSDDSLCDELESILAEANDPRPGMPITSAPAGSRADDSMSPDVNASPGHSDRATESDHPAR